MLNIIFCIKVCQNNDVTLKVKLTPRWDNILFRTKTIWYDYKPAAIVSRSFNSSFQELVDTMILHKKVLRLIISYDEICGLTLCVAKCRGAKGSPNPDGDVTIRLPECFCWSRASRPINLYSGSQSHTTLRGRASCSLW